MQTAVQMIFALASIYLLFAAFLYLYQRRLIYYPTPPDEDFAAQRISIDNQGTRLRGWVLNPGRKKALLYFGGNSEPITGRRDFLEETYLDYSVYLVDYRGYGNSDGNPSEQALCADALAIYDRLAADHESISAYGRSLGSGVAVFLAANRSLERLVLLTPYDSIAEVARRAYPLFPVRWLLKDRFDSAALAPDIDIPVLILSARNDRVIPLSHVLTLKERFTRATVKYRMIDGATHDDIVDFDDYRAAVRYFLIAGQR